MCGHSVAQSSPEDFLYPHNKARAQVGVQPLAWNYTIAAYAQHYANHRFADCNLEHSGGPYGENLAEGYGELKAADAVSMWVGEKQNYDYHSNSCVGDECLHYTQVVWRDSVHLGCARDFLDAHNAASGEVGVGKLTWDNALAAHAQSYVNERTRDCLLKLSQDGSRRSCTMTTTQMPVNLTAISAFSWCGATRFSRLRCGHDGVHQGLFPCCLQL
ncbi:hypothetical protein RJ639_011257 [Escallonia herrerae]|uniref:SCP domain-containing protein n=1 Tax=Escallonia herrerae TaxID=1293975 RepID=A0AA89APK6_9ASTE|nr:hypothetical protein RJ639_011257 [Escallonia herrerae]